MSANFESLYPTRDDSYVSHSYELQGEEERERCETHHVANEGGIFHADTDRRKARISRDQVRSFLGRATDSSVASATFLCNRTSRTACTEFVARYPEGTIACIFITTRSFCFRLREAVLSAGKRKCGRLPVRRRACTTSIRTKRGACVSLSAVPVSFTDGSDAQEAEV